MFRCGCLPCRPASAEVEEIDRVDKVASIGKDDYDDDSTALGCSKTSSLLSRSSLDSRELRTLSKGALLGLGDFDVGAVVGIGTFGRVQVVKVREHGENPLAMKIMEKARILLNKQVEHVRNEMDILRLVEHPYIVNLVQTFQDERQVYMLMEFVNGGELDSLIKVNGRLRDSHARVYAAQLTSALGYLHSLQVAYRDLKPENVLISSDGYVKITDFGFAKFVPDKTYTMCGTPEYVAPEVIRMQGHGRSVDWWALGVMIFEMLHGATPFQAESIEGVYEKVLAMQVRCPAHFDSNAKSLIKGLVAWRIVRLGGLSGGVEDIKSHPWFQEVCWRGVDAGEAERPWVPPIKSADDTSLFGDYKEVLASPAKVTPEEQEEFDFICPSEK